MGPQLTVFLSFSSLPYMYGTKSHNHMHTNPISMALPHCFQYLWMAVVITLPIACTPAEIATYIVHMDLSAMPQAFSGHYDWYSATLAATTTASEPISDAPRLVYAYDHALHGFRARLSSSQLEQLKKSHGYVSAYRDMAVKKDTTHTSDFLHLSPVSGLWPASNYGEDVIVGVVDTGIWPESESFKDDGMPAVPSRWKGACETGTAFNSSMCNRKLIEARSFNKGLLSHNPNLTIAVNSPRDTDGHGTHTSSTSAGGYAANASFFGYAAGTARGMAPRARLAMYKVIWDEGAYTSDIVAGIDRAIADGVDVVSLSLGLDSVPLYRDPIAIAAFSAMEKGIFVATSTGNRGPFLGTLHNGTPWVLTVGASTVDREFAGIVELGDGTSIIGQSLYPGRHSLVRDLPLVFMGSCDNRTLLKKTRHSIVVCDTKDSLGSLDFAIYFVKSAKVDGSVFISNSIYKEFFVHFTFPGTIVSPQDGLAMLQYIKISSNPRATLKFKETKLGIKPAPRVTSYTSRGPSPSCPTVLKPDLVAPGDLILASWAENSTVGYAGSQQLFNAFNIISGSSMSCPHGSGVAALLKSAHPEWSPAAIRSAMMTTASPLDNTFGPIMDMGDNRSASPVAMGSGHIEPNKALEPGLIYDAGVEDYVRLLCAMNYTREQIHMITRTATANCSNANLDLNYPSFIAFFSPNKNSSKTKSVREFQRTVTNVGDAMVTYSAKVVPVKGFKISIVPEKLVFEVKYEKQSFRLILEGHMGKKENQVVHGSLNWVDDQGKHVVRSPIVATTISSARV